MELKITPNADEYEQAFIERVLNALQSSVFGYTHDEAVMLVNKYYEKFTDPNFCKKYRIPVQTPDFFMHVEYINMADRIYYYCVLGNIPNEEAFIHWSNEFHKSLPGGMRDYLLLNK